MIVGHKLLKTETRHAHTALPSTRNLSKAFAHRGKPIAGNFGASCSTVNDPPKKLLSTPRQPAPTSTIFREMDRKTGVFLTGSSVSHRLFV